jgi:hypothetical protein
MRCTRLLSGAATEGFGGDFVADDMGGESTSERAFGKRQLRNCARPLLEVETHPEYFTVLHGFAGILACVMCYTRARV